MSPFALVSQFCTRSCTVISLCGDTISNNIVRGLIRKISSTISSNKSLSSRGRALDDRAIEFDWHGTVPSTMSTCGIWTSLFRSEVIRSRIHENDIASGCRCSKKVLKVWFISHPPTI